jgi:hypothetical protein
MTELDPAPRRRPRRKGPAEAAVYGELKGYPDRLRKSAIAATALLLARQMDEIPMVPRDWAGHARELRMCMTDLREQKPAGAGEDRTDSDRREVEKIQKLYVVES